MAHAILIYIAVGLGCCWALRPLPGLPGLWQGRLCAGRAHPTAGTAAPKAAALPCKGQAPLCCMRLPCLLAKPPGRAAYPLPAVASAGAAAGGSAKKGRGCSGPLRRQNAPSSAFILPVIRRKVQPMSPGKCFLFSRPGSRPEGGRCAGEEGPLGGRAEKEEGEQAC